MNTCMETIFPSPYPEFKYGATTLRRESNPKYQFCIQQLVQKPQFVAPDTIKAHVGRLEMKAD